MSRAIVTVNCIFDKVHFVRGENKLPATVVHFVHRDFNFVRFKAINTSLEDLAV